MEPERYCEFGAVGEGRTERAFSGSPLGLNGRHQSSSSSSIGDGTSSMAISLDMDLTSSDKMSALHTLRTEIKSTLDDFTYTYPDNPDRHAKLIQSEEEESPSRTKSDDLDFTQEFKLDMKDFESSPSPPPHHPNTDYVTRLPKVMEQLENPNPPTVLTISPASRFRRISKENLTVSCVTCKTACKVPEEDYGKSLYKNITTGIVPWSCILCRTCSTCASDSKSAQLSYYCKDCCKSFHLNCVSSLEVLTNINDDNDSNTTKYKCPTCPKGTVVRLLNISNTGVGSSSTSISNPTNATSDVSETNSEKPSLDVDTLKRRGRSKKSDEPDTSSSGSNNIKSDSTPSQNPSIKKPSSSRGRHTKTRVSPETGESDEFFSCSEAGSTSEKQEHDKLSTGANNKNTKTNSNNNNNASSDNVNKESPATTTTAKLTTANLDSHEAASTPNKSKKIRRKSKTALSTGTGSETDDGRKPKGLTDALSAFFTPTSKRRACTIKKENGDDSKDTEQGSLSDNSLTPNTLLGDTKSGKSHSKNPSQPKILSKRKHKVNYSEEPEEIAIDADNEAISHSQVSTTAINVTEGTIDLIDSSIGFEQQNESFIICISNSNNGKDLEILEENPSSTINLEDSDNNQSSLSSFNVQESDNIWVLNFPNDDDDDDNEDEETENTFTQNSTLLFVPGEMKTLLDHDYRLVNDLKKFVKIPSSVCIIDILEMYIKYFGLKAILKWWGEIKLEYEEIRPKAAKKSKLERKDQEKQKKRVTRGSKLIQDNPILAPISTANDYSITSKPYNPFDAFEQVEKSVEGVKSKMDDIRILFEYLLNHCLLYPEEKPHYNYYKMFRVEKKAEINHRNNKVLLPLILQCKEEFSETLSLSWGTSPGSSENPQPSSSTNFSHDPLGLKLKAQLFVNALLNFRLLPESEYNVTPTHPTLLFGMVHLTRLIVTIPEIFSKMHMKVEDRNESLKAVNAFTGFLSDFSDRLELLAKDDVIRVDAATGNEENPSSIMDEI